jgi:X-X-X-Leu-X-X-Gly heptad repeat protein
MADKVEIDTGLLRQSAVATDRVHAGIQQVLDTLTAAIAAQGKPWGDDHYGSTFFDGSDGRPGYGATSSQLTAGTGALATGVGEFAQQQRDAATLLDSTESGNADGFR